jgi:hypothetical protein
MLKGREVIVLMDTTYWRRTFGLIVMKDAISKKILWYDYIKRERIEHYQRGITWLEQQGFIIQAIVCDGLRGLCKVFATYKIQMCQFHQSAIIKRYLTTKPKLEAAIELKELMKIFTHTDKESFVGSFEQWYAKWEPFINERKIYSGTKRKRYVHKKLRSAYLSLRNNMKYLWTWYEYKDLGIPNTNNSLESFFSHLKNKLNLHNGLSIAHKKKFIDEYIRHKNLD